MGWQIKAGITGKTGRKATIELPISDSKMAQILQKLRMEPMDTTVTITDIEPQELASLGSVPQTLISDNTTTTVNICQVVG